MQQWLVLLGNGEHEGQGGTWDFRCRYGRVCSLRLHFHPETDEAWRAANIAKLPDLLSR
jgi:hypothetical protein